MTAPVVTACSSVVRLGEQRALASRVVAQVDVEDRDVPRGPTAASRAARADFWTAQLTTRLLERLLAPDAMQDHAQVPVSEAVAEEEEVSSRSSCAMSVGGNEVRDVRLREVVDVVVLGDDEAVAVGALACRPRRGASEHRLPVAAELAIAVRLVDHLLAAFRRVVHELAAVLALGDVDD